MGAGVCPGEFLRVPVPRNKSPLCLILCHTTELPVMLLLPSDARLLPGPEVIQVQLQGFVSSTENTMGIVMSGGGVYFTTEPLLAVKAEG